MIYQGLGFFRGKRVLLLQSPVGPFFRRLADDLRWAGAQVCKINFNGGDSLFYPRDAISFCGRPDEWPEFLRQFLQERDIDLILMFGDCRPVHRVARQVANQRGIEVGVFEEGYIRPHYVTLERYGVNGHSQMPRSPLFYLNREPSSYPPALAVRGAFWASARWAIFYYLACAVAKPRYRHYQHHRTLSLLEVYPWLRGFGRKWVFGLLQRGIVARLTKELSGRFFLVPLQVHNDAQILTHSGFDTVDRFIRYVVRSFASHANTDAHLVIKHHPMDRGYHDYHALIRKCALEHGLQGRLHYVHDIHLPTLLQHAQGVVVVNSTVGLSALYHDTPLKVCGSAIYDIPGLTFRGSLKEFWGRAASFRIDRELWRRFRNHLISHTQLNGNFYKRLDVPGSTAGLVWPRIVANESSNMLPDDEQRGYPNKNRTSVP